MSATRWDLFETSAGWVGLLASDVGVRRSTLPYPSPDEAMTMLGIEPEEAERDPSRLNELSSRIVAYFEGADADFADVPLDVDDATEFYRRAWSACRAVPRGQTRTYGWLAAQAGNPRAARAAGQTMARNRAPIIVPCHRIVGGDGSLRGFGRRAEMLDLKRALLEMERQSARLL